MRTGEVQEENRGKRKQAEKLKSREMKEGWMKNDEGWMKNDATENICHSKPTKVR